MYTDIYLFLDKARNNWKTEEEVRIGWCYAIKKQLNIELHAERDRSDASHNQVIIEFKNKGMFNGKSSSLKFKEAIYNRLEKYIYRKSINDGLSETRYIGIAIDADHIAFAYIPQSGSGIVHGPLLPLSEASVSLVMDVCKNSMRRAITASDLIEDFGHESELGHNLMQVLSDYLVGFLLSTSVNKIKMLFEEWKSLYGQVADLSLSQINLIEKSIGFTCNIKGKDRFSVILFVIHTYNSLIIKILAAEIVSKISNLSSYSDFTEIIATKSDDEIINILDEDIERAAIYSRANIKGFVEEALFSWYIDAYKSNELKYLKSKLCESLREIFIRFSSYLIDDLSHARANDVLKSFYQNLVPDVLRKSLGEFYTPDWLVQILLDEVDGDFCESRFLDPTCGSASFLLAIISRIREASTLNSKELLETILNNVWGFDLNPLAVQTSRLNYLMAISDLIQDNLGVEIEIPVLLADAIYSPAPDPKGDTDIVTYTIGSHIANLTITLPTELAMDRIKLDKVFDLMAKHVEENSEYSLVSEELVKSNAICFDEQKVWKQHLEDTYNRVLQLHRRQWNGIWFRIVRNYFWSATAGKFDVVIGNPPWVRWSKLPELYRQRVKPTCLQYKIFSDTPYHGGNELDISGMITYTVADKWLKQKGQLIFLVTQTHFQSASSQGFRQFNINDYENLVPISVDDLKMIKPFPDAANKTAIFKAEKSLDKPNYPVKYNEWLVEPGNSRTIPEKLLKEEVLKRINREEKEAIPINGDGSPWAVLPKGQFENYRHLSGSSDWVVGRKGITCDLNGVYFVKILQTSRNGELVQIETRPEAGKIEIGPPQRFWVEPNLLYPLMKGAGDIKPCEVKPKQQLYAIVPNKGITKAAYEEAIKNVEINNPKLFEYFKKFESLLRLRSTYKGRMKNAPYYCVYNVGTYTFAPWKLVWAEQPGNRYFPSAVINCGKIPGIGDKILIPDHKIYFADFSTSEPAYYLCGLLQSDMVQTYLKSYLVLLQVGDIFKNLLLPEYNPQDKRHVELVKLVEMAHKTTEVKGKSKLLIEISTLANQIVFKKL